MSAEESDGLKYPGMNNRLLQRSLQPLRSARGRKVDVFLTRVTGWSFLCYFYQARSDSHPIESPALLRSIHTRTGELRENVLSCWRDPDGDGWLLCGTNGGQAKDPQWVRNLRGDQNCWIRYERVDHPARAEELTGDEYRRIHDYINERHPKLDLYGRSAAEHGRIISIWRLRPRTSAVTTPPSASTAERPVGGRLRSTVRSR